MLEDTEEEVCQKMDMLEIALKLPKQSMPDEYSVILEYEGTQEAESIIILTIIVDGWIRST